MAAVGFSLSFFKTKSEVLCSVCLELQGGLGGDECKNKNSEIYNNMSSGPEVAVVLRKSL